MPRARSGVGPSRLAAALRVSRNLLAVLWACLSLPCLVRGQPMSPAQLAAKAELLRLPERGASGLDAWLRFSGSLLTILLACLAMPCVQSAQPTSTAQLAAKAELRCSPERGKSHLDAWLRFSCSLLTILLAYLAMPCVGGAQPMSPMQLAAKAELLRSPEAGTRAETAHVLSHLDGDQREAIVARLRELAVERPLLGHQRVDRLGWLGVGHDPRPPVVGEPPLVDGHHARVNAQPLGGPGGGVEPLAGAALGQRRVERHRDRPAAQPLADRGEQRARDALSDEGEIAAPGDVRRLPSHDDGPI